MTKHLTAQRVATAATALGQLGINRLQSNPLVQFLVVTSLRSNPGEQRVRLSPDDVTDFCERWFAVEGHEGRPWFVPMGPGWVKMAPNRGYPVGTVWSTLIESSAKRDQVFHAQVLPSSEREVSLEEEPKLLAGLRALVHSGGADRRLPLRELAVWRFRLAELADDVNIEDLERQILEELKLTEEEQRVLLDPPSPADPSAVWNAGPPDASALLDLLPPPPDPTGQLADLASPSRPRAPLEVPVVDVELDDRLWRVIRNAVASFTCVLLVGPPGTGKGQILARIAQEVAERPELYGFDGSAHEDGWPDPVVKTPHEGWQTFDLIGGHIADPGGGLRWAAGFVLDAIRDDRWVVLDETNRGDLDKIMGPMITWLAGGVSEIGATSTHETRRPILLGWTDAAACRTTPPEGIDTDSDVVSGPVEYRAGRDWRLLGSFNPQDAQRVFAIGQALGRRFKSVPIPPLDPPAFEHLLTRQFPALDPDAVRRIKLLYTAHLDSLDGVLGPALFLDVARYVAQSMFEAAAGPEAEVGAEGGDDGGQEGDRSDHEPGDAGVHRGDQDSGGSVVETLVAEGYLVVVGRFLANLDPSVLAELRTNSADALSDAQWRWVTDGLKALAL